MSNSTYKSLSWWELARLLGRMLLKNAIETASKTLKDLRVAEITKLD